MELVKNRTGVEEKFYKIVEKVVDENQYQLYDFEYISGSSTLRVFIMDKETQTAVIEDCIKVDRAMSPYFEEEWVPNDVVLEVSSPGMYRSLKTLAHFELALNKRIACSIRGKLDEQLVEGAPKSVKKGNAFIGILKNINEENIIIDIDGFELALTFEQMKKANLEPEL